MADADPYATGKANLRDTVKWLATTFAALGAVVLAGSPFTGFGSLPLGAFRFWVAVGGLIGSAIFFFMAWRRIVLLLRPDLVFPRYLRTGFHPTSLGQTEEAEEIRRLREVFQEHRDDLLPAGLSSYDDLEAKAELLWQQAEAVKDGSTEC